MGMHAELRRSQVSSILVHRSHELQPGDLADTLRTDDFDLDLEAVVDGVGLERFLLFAAPGSTHVAVRYAIKHRDRVYGLKFVIRGSRA